MKKFQLLVMILCLSFMLVGCGPDPYAKITLTGQPNGILNIDTLTPQNDNEINTATSQNYQKGINAIAVKDIYIVQSDEMRNNNKLESSSGIFLVTNDNNGIPLSNTFINENKSKGLYFREIRFDKAESYKFPLTSSDKYDSIKGLILLISQMEANDRASLERVDRFYYFPVTQIVKQDNGSIQLVVDFNNSKKINIDNRNALQFFNDDRKVRSVSDIINEFTK